MSEILKSEADQSSVLPETVDYNPMFKEEDAFSTDTKNEITCAADLQNVIAQDVHSTENECPDAVKETNAPEIVNGDVPINAVALDKETVIESAKDIVANTLIPKILENEPKDELPSTTEIQQQITIGAGDTCFIGKSDKNADGQQSIKEMTDQTPMIDEKSLVGGDKGASDDELTISKLKEEFQKTTEERDSYKKKLESTEKKLAALQASYDTLMKGEGDEAMLRRMIDQLKGKLIQTSLQLEDRIRIVSNQEKQISALNNQVASLKEVESLTRSLLQIRNMEVKHLQTEVDNMEVRISEERDRYNTMINKMDAAVKLNADLKKEYETQLCLFRDLREKYEEKVTLLSEEKRALENNAQNLSK